MVSHLWPVAQEGSVHHVSVESSFPGAQPQPMMMCCWHLPPAYSNEGRNCSKDKTELTEGSICQGALWKTGLLTEALDRQGATGHRGGSIEQANQKKARHSRDSERVQSLRADGEGLSPGASRGAGQQSQSPTGLQPEGTAAASF